MLQGASSHQMNRGNAEMRPFSVTKAGLRWLAMALLLFAGLAAAAPAAWAQGFGDLIVSPTRVELEGRTRSATVTLTNKGSESALFRISLVTMAMDDKGNLKTLEAPEAGQLVAEDLVRYAPRQVTIPPGGTQTVRLSVRKPKDLAAGEYRSHMFFRAVPPEDAGRAIAGQQQEQGIQVKLTPIFGITIPVIVRHGDLNATVKMDGLAVGDAAEAGKKKLSVTLKREGTRSAFGDLQVQYVPAAGGDAVVVGEVTRLAVFTPNKQRIVDVPLTTPPGVTLGKGTLKVLYRQVDGDATLASGEIALP